MASDGIGPLDAVDGQDVAVDPEQVLGVERPPTTRARMSASPVTPKASRTSGMPGEFVGELSEFRLVDVDGMKAISG